MRGMARRPTAGMQADSRAANTVALRPTMRRRRIVLRQRITPRLRTMLRHRTMHRLRIITLRHRIIVRHPAVRRLVLPRRIALRRADRRLVLRRHIVPQRVERKRALRRPIARRRVGRELELLPAAEGDRLLRRVAEQELVLRQAALLTPQLRRGPQLRRHGLRLPRRMPRRPRRTTRLQHRRRSRARVGPIRESASALSLFLLMLYRLIRLNCKYPLWIICREVFSFHE